MDENGIAQAIRQLVLKARRNIFGKSAGPRATRRRGEGFEFEELREYQAGDTIRSVDWKSSARTNRLMVRSYHDDRNRSIMLLLDISKSGDFGSGKTLKEEVIKNLAVLLSSVAYHEHDGVGVVLFDAQVREFLPIKSGRAHHILVCKQVLNATAHAGVSSVQKAFAVCMQRVEPNALVILVSDCLYTDIGQLLPAVARRHELVVLRVYDPVERALPKNMLMRLEDPETGEIVEAVDPVTMRDMHAFQQSWLIEQNALFKKYGVDCCDINVQHTSTEYVNALVQFFDKR